MARSKSQLVCQHLERTSSDVLKYKEIIREYIRNRQGVYALYKKDKLYYIGLASNLIGRLKTHLRDKHEDKWNRFSIYLTKDDKYLRELESLVLRISDPTGNVVKGKLKDSENLRKKIWQDISIYEKEKIRRIFGGKKKSMKSAKITSLTKDKKPILSQYIRKPFRIRATYKGFEYRALVRKSGTIKYNDKIYNSPSGAGKAVKGRVTNGWKFWKFRKGYEWVLLDELRK